MLFVRKSIIIYLFLRDLEGFFFIINLEYIKI